MPDGEAKRVWQRLGATFGSDSNAQTTPITGSPFDMPGMTALIEEAIRYPGFSFVNIQSPCITFGEEEQQLKAHKGRMKPLASLGHDPADQLAALDLARSYGTELYTGVFYRNPRPPPTYEALVRERQAELQRGEPRRRERVLDGFLKS